MTVFGEVSTDSKACKIIVQFSRTFMRGNSLFVQVNQDNNIEGHKT